MVKVNVLIKNIETDPTGESILFTVEASIGGTVTEIRFGEMIGNFGGMTEAEVRQRLKGILRDILSQKVREKDELTPQKIWKRTPDYIGATFTIEVD